MPETKSFFLVDDDIDDIALFEEALKEIDPNIECQSAINGRDALDRLSTDDASLPDIIFLDLNMPRLDGRQCLQELKKLPTLQSIPVVMYSTSSNSRDIESTMRSGAVCFITKPPDFKELKEILSAFASVMQPDVTRVIELLGPGSRKRIAY